MCALLCCRQSHSHIARTLFPLGCRLAAVVCNDPADDCASRSLAFAVAITHVETLLGSARAARERGDPAAASVALSEALAMWRGQPLGEFADVEWARPETAWLAELGLRVLEERGAAELACGRHVA